MRAILLFVAIQLIFELCIGQNCVYTDQASGRKLYLDALEHATLMHRADEFNDKHTYTYTPCRNAAGECTDPSGGKHTAMCRQTLDGQADICTVIANVDSSVSPTYNDNADGTWEFIFQNGDDEGCGAPRKFNVFLYCDETAGDYKIVSAGELGVSCTYEFNIKTKWACPGQVYVEPDKNSLSGGWIFVIFFLSVVFAYFVFGWCLCAYLNRKDRGFGDVTGNIPHITFWTKIPALTFAGCCFTKDFLLGLCSKNDASGFEEAETGGANGGNYENIDK